MGTFLTVLFLQFRCHHGIKIELDIVLAVGKPGGGTAALDEETPAHCEHTVEFMTTCLIVNEPPQFVHILGMVFDLVNRFLVSKAAETSDSTICSPEVKGN